MLAIGIIDNLHKVIIFLIFARVILSFFPQMDRGNAIVQFLHTVTEPILAPFRNILPSTQIGIDFSPLFALLVVDLVFRLLISLFAP